MSELRGSKETRSLFTWPRVAAAGSVLMLAACGAPSNGSAEAPKTVTTTAEAPMHSSDTVTPSPGKTQEQGAAVVKFAFESHGGSNVVQVYDDPKPGGENSSHGRGFFADTDDPGQHPVVLCTETGRAVRGNNQWAKLDMAPPAYASLAFGHYEGGTPQPC